MLDFYGEVKQVLTEQFVNICIFSIRIIYWIEARQMFFFYINFILFFELVLVKFWLFKLKMFFTFDGKVAENFWYNIGIK